MSLGRIEMIVIRFPDSQFNGSVAPALVDLIERGLVRVIDLVFMTKGADGSVAVVELADAGDEVRQAFEPLVDEVTGLISEEDEEDLGEALDEGDSAAILLFEHLWAKEFADAVRSSGGELAFSMQVPPDVVEAALAAG
jgi:hypothetical protein